MVFYRNTQSLVDMFWGNSDYWYYRCIPDIYGDKYARETLYAVDTPSMTNEDIAVFTVFVGYWCPHLYHDSLFCFLQDRSWIPHSDHLDCLNPHYGFIYWRIRSPSD